MSRISFAGIVVVCAIVTLSPMTISAKGEYNSKYLYAKVNDDDRGGIVVHLEASTVKPVIAIAVGRRLGRPYRGVLEAKGARARFSHLPVDVYDLLFVTNTGFYEGFSLVRKPDAARKKKEGTAVEAEVKGIEAFFDRKRVHRLEIEGERAVTLVQQWRVGVALAESGAVLEGVIHSIDLIWFEKPKKGWQLTRRCQLYRDELDLKGPLSHHHMAKLGNIRVIKKVKDIKGVALQ